MIEEEVHRGGNGEGEGGRNPICIGGLAPWAAGLGSLGVVLAVLMRLPKGLPLSYTVQSRKLFDWWPVWIDGYTVVAYSQR